MTGFIWRNVIKELLCTEVIWEIVHRTFSGYKVILRKRVWMEILSFRKCNKQRHRNRNEIEKFLPAYLSGIVIVFHASEKHSGKRMERRYEYFLSDVHLKSKLPE